MRLRRLLYYCVTTRRLIYYCVCASDACFTTLLPATQDSYSSNVPAAHAPQTPVSAEPQFFASASAARLLQLMQALLQALLQAP